MTTYEDNRDVNAGLGMSGAILLVCTVYAWQADCQIVVLALVSSTKRVCQEKLHGSGLHLPSQLRTEEPHGICSGCWLPAHSFHCQSVRHSGNSCKWVEACQSLPPRERMLLVRLLIAVVDCDKGSDRENDGHIS